MSKSSLAGNVFTLFTGVATSASLTSAPADIRDHTLLRSYVRFTGGASGTLIKEATLRSPNGVGGPWDTVVGRFPAIDWTTVESLVVSRSNAAADSGTLFTNNTNSAWAYTRFRWIPAVTASVTGTISTFTSAKL